MKLEEMLPHLLPGEVEWLQGCINGSRYSVGVNVNSEGGADGRSRILVGPRTPLPVTFVNGIGMSWCCGILV